MVFTSSSERVWTSERFARRAEGKAVGLETVMTVFEEVSTGLCQLMLVSVSFLQCSPTLVICAANGTGQDDVLFACTTIKKISTVGAEDEGADSRHFWNVVAGDGCLDWFGEVAV